MDQLDTQPPAPSPLVGVQFGNYAAVDLLGRGTMGEVYLGVHPEIGRRVAIKVLASDLAEVPAMESRFLEEARAISRIKHANIIEIYDFGRLEGGRPYYVMELLAGRPLSDELIAGPLSVDRTRQLAQQICCGLQVAHDAKIVHRDLKPENIFLVDGDPTIVKLLDFGLAKLLPSERCQTGRGVILGTPTVIAPEQVAARGQIGPWTDLYALGAVLFWMLAGRPPFDDDAPAVLLARHLDDPAPDLRSVAPTVPASLAAVVARCLEKAPEARPASASEIARAIADDSPSRIVASTAPARPRRSGTLRAPTELAIRRRASPLLIGLGVAGLAGIAALVAASRPRAPTPSGAGASSARRDAGAALTIPAPPPDHSLGGVSSDLGVRKPHARAPRRPHSTQESVPDARPARLSPDAAPPASPGKIGEGTVDPQDFPR